MSHRFGPARTERHLGIRRARAGRWPARLAAAAIAFGSLGATAVEADEPIQPIPTARSEDPARVAIGRMLFNDTRLSANGSLSCASCHDLTKGGGDGRPRSIGFAGRATNVNAPTVFNASLNFRQFWDGRAATLEAQVDEVVRSPVEMGSRWSDVVAKVAADAAYRNAFAAAYADGVSKRSIGDAIARYERTLTTPNSRFDRWLRGDARALTEPEKAGYAAFKRFGCVACHQGVNVGGNMYQKFGYFRPRSSADPSSEGRFAITGRPEDKQVFKVPSLRNVALTAPYFHDASARTLEDAVDVMFALQLGRTASREDRTSIVLFLNTLTGDMPRTP